VVVGEPGDLVVEVRMAGVVEDGAGDLVELGGWPQPGGQERLVQRVADAVEVEVAEDEKVGVPLRGPVRPGAHPLGRANCSRGFDTDEGSTISATRPEGWTRVLS
jgi:hypothetical protein